MYYFISGRLVKKSPAFVVLEAGGIGYEIRITLNTFSAIKELDSCTLYTYFHVKEDAHTLFGFQSEAEKMLFVQLLSVSGIGPSSAVLLLSSLTVPELQDAILQGNVKLIQSVKGVGTKTAQRLVLELRDKLAKGQPEGTIINKVPVISAASRVADEAIEALVALGIPKATAEKNVESVIKQHGAQIALEDLIKYTFKTR